MRILNYAILVVLMMPFSNAQSLFSEVGVGIGRGVGHSNSLGKLEAHLNLLKAFKVGEIGIDLSTGGNMVIGNVNEIEDNIETISPNSFSFTSVSTFYRLPVINEKIFIEPRIGYLNLYKNIEADNQERINKSNFSYGLGIGLIHKDKFTFTIRYEYQGETPEYSGINGSSMLISESQPVNLIMLRVAYRLNWRKIFNN